MEMKAPPLESGEGDGSTAELEEGGSPAPKERTTAPPNGAEEGSMN